VLDRAAEVEVKQLVELLFIALSLPPLEDDLPPDIRSKLATLPLSSDAELWKITNSIMDESQQAQLEN